MTLKNKIIDVLRQCYDPEIPIDLWNLGLIYNIEFDECTNEKSDVLITMSLTTPGCSMGQHMADDIKNKVSLLKEVNNCDVSVTFDPPWNPEMMSGEAREKLGFDPISISKQETKIDMEWE